MPLIIVMLLAGFILASTVIPWSGRPFSPRYRSVRNACVMMWCRLVSGILNLRISRLGSPALEAGLSLSNHISWLDILALATERDLVFVAKHEVSSWPLMGAIFKGIGTIFIRRGDRDAALKTADEMREHFEKGVALLLFPEATTTNGSTVRRFASKLLEPAVETKVWVQPVALRYTGPSSQIVPFIGDDTFVHHLLKILTLPEILLTISYGSVVPASIGSKEELARTLRETVVALIENRPEPVSGELLQNRHNPFTPLSH